MNNKLKGNRIGIVFGTFAPMHLGHYQAIIRAKRENDGVVVVVSGYEGDRGDEIGLSLNKRFRYARELFKDDNEVYVTYVNEDGIPRYPDGWSRWMELMEEAVLNSIHDIHSYDGKEFNWYVGEQEYVDEIDERTDIYHYTTLLDRDLLPISGALIRSNPLKYWNYITRPFRRHFSTNVLITGTASGGKSTLVKDLARSFGAPFSEEYARLYEEESGITDEELVANDFQYFTTGQFDMNRKIIQSPSNNGLFLSDTDVILTELYSELYLTGTEHHRLRPSYQMLAEKQKWDLIIIIPPVTDYVDDGFRDMNHSDEKLRWKMHNRLIALYEGYGFGDKIHVLSNESKYTDSQDPKGFYSRYTEARDVINQYTKKQYGIDLDVRMMGE